MCKFFAIMTNQNFLHDFVINWTGKGYEKGESQPFWIALLEALGVDNATEFIRFEEQVHIDRTAFIDGFIHSTKVLIEQKSVQKDLGAPVRQSDGSLLNPFQQAKRYAAELPYSVRPRWIVTCNFREFWVYDMEQPHVEPQRILLQNLEKEHYRLKFLVDQGNEQLKKEMELSIKAGDLVGRIYDAILPQYANPESPETLQSLNQLCVRLVFCLFAEDAGLFGDRNEFHDYLSQYPAKETRRALMELFRTLDTPVEERDPYLNDDLKAFPYVNGSLFSDEDIEIPQFTEDIKQLILTRASEDFDWSEISPTIFGAVFESTLNPETRRSGGMHYTSIENIHKVIDPLFMDTLNDEFSKCETKKQLVDLQNKLARLKFLDPACGSGNFLTESFISLRRLENKIIRRLKGGQMMLGTIENPVKVDIHQFYGIEINDFAVTVATTALWIAELQMMRETANIMEADIDSLPLTAYHNIKEGNALRVSWTRWEEPDETPTIFAKKTRVYRCQKNDENTKSHANEAVPVYGKLNLITEDLDVMPEQPETYYVDFDYIMGNPPFVGARMKSEEQTKDMLDLFGKNWKDTGNLDYVGGWYLKAAREMQSNPNAKAAFVSTNSITQGEQVPILWDNLCNVLNVKIDFAYKTFVWDSDSNQKAHVHCVIIGFGKDRHDERSCKLYSDSGKFRECKYINAYLVEAQNIFVKSRTKPLCDVPEMGVGNKPIDDGNYLFTEKEKADFIKNEPLSEKYFHRWYGADEFINNKLRYCLWLGNCSPNELKNMPYCYKRVAAVREFRLASKSKGTRKIADRPTRFHIENMPEENFILIPETSSERREYIPIGFMNPNVLCSNAVRLIPDATLYHFGILTSSVHMAWMRAVCGRLKSDYRYSKDVVYNNFPWPEPTGNQRLKIEQTAQAILDARAKHPDCSLSDLYDEVTMPVDLRRAHQDNDRAVMSAYGFDTKMNENERVAKLLELYRKMTGR